MMTTNFSLTNNSSTNVKAGSGTSTGLAIPGTYTYVNSHGALTSVITGSTSTSYPSSFEFYDDFIFTVAPASARRRMAVRVTPGLVTITAQG